jgi:hypothetical protein
MTLGVEVEKIWGRKEPRFAGANVMHVQQHLTSNTPCKGQVYVLRDHTTLVISFWHVMSRWKTEIYAMPLDEGTYLGCSKIESA